MADLHLFEVPMLTISQSKNPVGRLKSLSALQARGETLVDWVRRLRLSIGMSRDEIVALGVRRGFLDEEMDGKQKIILCHYPIESWDCKYHGSWHLHGHSHGLTPSLDSMARLDVGVDAQKYQPISYEEIKYVMTNKALRLAGKEKHYNEMQNRSFIPVIG